MGGPAQWLYGQHLLVFGFGLGFLLSGGVSGCLFTVGKGLRRKPTIQDVSPIVLGRVVTFGRALGLFHSGGRGEKCYVMP